MTEGLRIWFPKYPRPSNTNRDQDCADSRRGQNDDNLKDLENAIRVHKLLSQLTPLQSAGSTPVVRG